MYSPSLYGSNPITFCEYHFSQEMLEFIQEDPLFTCPNDQGQLESIGYCRAVDKPGKPGHIYYEAYFHSLPVHSPISSMHPRWGMLHDKEPASVRLAAVFEGIRRKNSTWIRLLRERVTNEAGLAGAGFATIIEENRLFGGAVFPYLECRG